MSGVVRAHLVLGSEHCNPNNPNSRKRRKVSSLSAVWVVRITMSGVVRAHLVLGSEHFRAPMAWELSWLVNIYKVILHVACTSENFPTFRARKSFTGFNWCWNGQLWGCFFTEYTVIENSVQYVNIVLSKHYGSIILPHHKFFSKRCTLIILFIQGHLRSIIFNTIVINVVFHILFLVEFLSNLEFVSNNILDGFSFLKFHQASSQ